MSEAEPAQARSADQEPAAASGGPPPGELSAGTPHALQWWVKAPLDHGRGMTWRWGFNTPLLLIALHGVLAWVGRAPGILTRQDDARYLGLANALRIGQFRDFMWPDAPLHHMYPPGYPALLSVWITIGGAGFDWLVALHVALSVATLALVFDAVRRVISPLITLTSLLILALNPWLLVRAGQVGSEGALGICFALAVWGTVALPRGRKQFVLVIAAAAAAPLMRGSGIALPAALVLHWLSERRYRDAVIAGIVSLAVLAPLMWWVTHDPYAVVGSSYAADLAATTNTDGGLLATLAFRVRSHALYYASQGIPVLLPLPTVAGTIVDNVAWTILVVAGLTVGSVTGFSRFRLGVLSVLATAALLVVWVFQANRFLEPLLPLVVVVLLLGVARIAAVRGARVATAAVLLVGGVVVAQGATLSVHSIARVLACDRTGEFPDEQCVSDDQRGFFRAARFVRDSLPLDARIVTLKSEPLNFYSGRITVPYQRYTALKDEPFWRAMSAIRTEYVLLGNLQHNERSRLAPLIARRCGSLALVRVFSLRTFLFRVDTSAEALVRQPAGAASAGGGSPACDAVQRYLANTPEQVRDESLLRSH